jgi:hypothetical protein
MISVIRALGDSDHGISQNVANLAHLRI